MATKKDPFKERDYTYDPKYNQFYPLLDIQLGSQKSKKKILALADTGCTSCISLCKKYIEKEGLTLGRKVSVRPIPVSVADGHSINGDLYLAVCDIDGIEKEVIVCVIDPEEFFEKEESEIEIVEPLLGRGVLDHFDSLFKGKERKVALFHPDKSSRETP